MSWADILEDAGWTLVVDRDGNAVEDRDGRQSWTRPHREGEQLSSRSLVTDWYGSPHVGSLQSLSPSTGLLELHEAGIPLSKARVAAQLWCGGSLADLYRSWLPSRAAGMTSQGADDV